MPTIGPRALIQAPPLEQLRVNLRSSARIVEDNARWQLGIAYSPERPAGGGSVDPRSDGVGAGTKTTTDSPADVEWDPYIIWAGDQCSTLGTDFEDIRARAERQLEVQTSHLVEGILWTNRVDGALYSTGGAHPNVGLSFTGAIQPNGFTVSPFISGWSELIKNLGTYLGGARGMIHVEYRLLPLISFYGLAVKEGNRLITTLGDHIVVPGTGYTGSDPSNNAPGEFHSWIYATSMVELRLGPIEVFFDESQSINRSTNEIEYRAERMALAHWDRNAHIGLSVCLEDPAGGCSDSAS